MNTKTKEPQEWKSCDSGFLVGISERAKVSRRRQSALRASVAAMVVLFAVGLGVWSTGRWSSPKEYYFGGIACHEVREHMPAMTAGTLPEELRTRIETHLRECPVCREMMQKMGAGQAAAGISQDYWTCDCRECQRQNAYAILWAKRSMGLGKSVLAASFPPRLLADQH